MVRDTDEAGLGPYIFNRNTFNIDTFISSLVFLYKFVNLPGFL